LGNQWWESVMPLPGVKVESELLSWQPPTITLPKNRDADKPS